MLYQQFWNACEDGDVTEVQNLIQKIDDINKPNPKGWNAIILASFNHHVKIVELLLQNGANINSTNNNGTTVLMYAKTKVLENSNYAFLDLLLAQGATINAKDKKNNWTVLDYVKQSNHQPLINYLISKGAK